MERQTKSIARQRVETEREVVRGWGNEGLEKRREWGRRDKGREGQRKGGNGEGGREGGRGEREREREREREGGREPESHAPTKRNSDHHTN